MKKEYLIFGLFCMNFVKASEITSINTETKPERACSFILNCAKYDAKQTINNVAAQLAPVSVYLLTDIMSIAAISSIGSYVMFSNPLLSASAFIGVSIYGYENASNAIINTRNALHKELIAITGAQNISLFSLSQADAQKYANTFNGESQRRSTYIHNILKPQMQSALNIVTSAIKTVPHTIASKTYEFTTTQSTYNAISSTFSKITSFGRTLASSFFRK
jgi:hypothetical protein